MMQMTKASAHNFSIRHSSLESSSVQNLLQRIIQGVQFYSLTQIKQKHIFKKMPGSQIILFLEFYFP